MQLCITDSLHHKLYILALHPQGGRDVVKNERTGTAGVMHGVSKDLLSADFSLTGTTGTAVTDSSVPTALQRVT